MRFNVAVIFLVACVLTGLKPAVAQPANLDSQIHDALMRHPEWLTEMNQLLQQRQLAAQQATARKAIAENRDALFNDARDPVVGNPRGDVTVAIFQDKQCPFCKALAPDLARLVAEDKNVRLIYKEFPILGPASTVAARAALASMRQGKFADFNARLFADSTPERQLTEAHIMEIATASGIDIARLKADMSDPAIDAHIANNKKLAEKIGIDGTPGIIVDNRLFPGVMAYNDLKKAVDEARVAKHKIGK